MCYFHDEWELLALIKCSLYIAADNKIVHQHFLEPGDNTTAMPPAHALHINLTGSIIIPGIPSQNMTEKAVTRGNLEFSMKIL